VSNYGGAYSCLYSIKARTLLAPILARGPVKRLIAFSKVPISEKKLHARQAVIFTSAAYRAAEGFLKRPTEKNLLNFLLLPRLLGLGLQKGGLGPLLRDFSSSIPTLESLEGDLKKPKATRPPIASTPAQRATKLLGRGYLGRAASVTTPASTSRASHFSHLSCVVTFTH
jgi:hypothetical protein